jgi:Ca-activated chloride channel family protein
MNVPKLRLFFLMLCLMGSVTGWLILPSATAQTTQDPIQESVDKKPKGGVLLKTASGKNPLSAPLLKTMVTMTISGLIARTTVSQQFSNPSDEWAEGIYVFPLPDQAAVDHLRMKIGEQLIEGQIQERTQAKKAYSKAKAKGQRASLVEQERPNIFTTSVANIAPHAPITIEIEYQEIVHYDQGRFSLRFPMVVGPRYIPGHPEDIREASSLSPAGLGWAANTDQVPDASRITPPVQHPSEGSLNPMALQIDLAPGMLLQKIESPTHPITITKQDTNAYQVSLQDASTYADPDFELIWTPLSHDTPQASVFTEQHEGETFLFMQLMPPTSPALAEDTIPREVIFVIDTSGSMAGKSLKEAQAALTLALSRLSPHDSFNIIQFNSVTRTLYSTAQLASGSRIHEAKRYVNGLQATGGTEMLPALKQALAHQPNQEESHRLRQIIFMTDGLVGNEEALFSLLQRDLHDTRLFTVGIGSAPNGHFMRKAARFGKGTFTYIGSTTEVQDKMNRLFVKLEHPALTDITIQSGDSTFGAMLPDPLPDLYSGEPLTVAFRTTNLPSSITISGKQAGNHWGVTHSLADAKTRSGIRVYWARQKIMQLMDQGTQEKDKTLLRQSIVDLALTHHLVSRYTSLVAIDVTPARPDAQALTTHSLKTNLPNGMQFEAIFGWPQTDTPATFYLVIGSLLLCLTWILSRQHLTDR